MNENQTEVLNDVTANLYTTKSIVLALLGSVENEGGDYKLDKEDLLTVLESIASQIDKSALAIFSIERN